MQYRTRAICLRTADYSETSQVVHFLTRAHGVVRLLAKGAKRPKSKSGGAIDLLSEGELVFIPSGGEGLGTLIEFSESTSHGKLRRETGRLYTALYMLELIAAMLAERDPHPEVYDLLHSALARLADADAPVAAVLGYFQWRVLRCVGLLGDLDCCTECGRTIIPAKPPTRRAVYFSSTVGGLVCRECELSIVEKFRVGPAGLAGLMVLQTARKRKELGQKPSLSDAQANSVNRLLSYHITQQLGKELKLTPYAIPPRSGR